MVYLKSVKNVITLGKLIGLLFLFCVPLLSILLLKTPKIRGTRRSVEHCTPHADGAWLNELGWSQ